MAASATGIAGFGALVTGGGSGIGLGAAKLLAAEGAHVTICGRTESKLVDACEQIRAGAADGSTVQYIVADVTVEDAVVAAIEAAAKPAGKLDVLFANAGGSAHMGHIADAELESFRATIELNLTGTFLCLKHGYRSMAATGGGSIIGMSSGAGHFPHRCLPIYGAAKAGIDMLCQYAAEEMGAAGVRVNTVRPGIVANDLMAPITAGGKLMDDYHEQMPLHRAGDVDDIARLVRFLAGPESSWITGACIPIDGGHHLRRGANYSLLFE
jgi:NAD(P)-dependent dehydrogenase (short-subunit alcohol dehydrogenase family)